VVRTLIVISNKIIAKTSIPCLDDISTEISRDRVACIATIDGAVHSKREFMVTLRAYFHWRSIRATSDRRKQTCIS
jgi:hypothetical protein